MFINKNLFSQNSSNNYFENPDSCIYKYVNKIINSDFTRYEMWSKFSKKHTSLDEYKYFTQKYLSDRYIGYKIDSVKYIEHNEKYKNYIVYYYTTNNDTIKRLITLELDSTFWFISNNLSIFIKGWESLKKEKFSDAIKYFSLAIEIEPYDAKSYEYLAITYYNLSIKDSTVSKSLIAENAKLAINYEPDNQQHYCTMGMYFSSLKSFNLAIQYYLKGLEVTKKSKDLSSIYSNLTSMYFENDDTINCKKYADLSIKTDSTEEFTYYILGKFNFKYNRFLIAKSYFEKSINSTKLTIDILVDMYTKYAICCYLNKDCNLAKLYYMKAVDIKPNNDWNDKFAKEILECN